MDFNSPDIFIKIKKLEFKYLLVPLLLIIANFILVYIYKMVHLKYISIGLLIIYFFIKLLFRISRIDVEISDKQIKAPVCGTVQEIQSNEIVIKKSLFDKSDIRKSNAEFLFIKGKPHILQDNTTQSALIGVVPGIALCKVTLPQNSKIKVKTGDKVKAGISDLGEYNE